MAKKVVVAVDGPAGSGKSSVCREVALRCNLHYIDSGALYRAVTLFLLRKYGALQHNAKYVKDLKDLKLFQQFTATGTCATFMNDEDVTNALRDEVIAKNIGIVSDDPEIRDFVNAHLRKWAENDSIIMDGRDIGTVVFPNADVKIYLDASVEERTKRRCAEYAHLGKTVDVNEVRNQIIQRDSEDMRRPVGALQKAHDAIVIDTSSMTKEEVIEKLVSIVNQKMTFAENGIDGTSFNGIQSENASRTHSEQKGYSTMIHQKESYEETINMEQVANTALEDIRPNTILKGEIVTIDNEFAYVNVGAKSDGRVALTEFETPPKVGDEIYVMLINKRMLDGMYVFSTKAATKKIKWDNFIKYYREGNTTVSGKVVEIGTKGISVDCMGLRAFVPFSQGGDIRVKKSPDTSVEYRFKIKKVDEKRQSVILSRKEYLEEEAQRIWTEFANKHFVGERVMGKVLRFLNNGGAIVEIDGVEAYLAKENMSWKKVFKRRKVIKQGTQREFVILAIDVEKKKVEIGLKQTEEDPWSLVDSKYRVGAVVSGKVMTVTNFGMFVEIENGIEGLVSANDISWTKKNVNPKELYRVGQKVEAQILSIDKDARKMQLGIKQLLPNPWDTIEQRYPVGTIMKGKIKTLVPFGIFVEIEEGVDGLVHISDVSWDEDNKNVLESYKAGQEVEFKILSIDREEMKISCGMKQLVKSPWEIISEKYPPRTRLSGIVTRISNFGLFVRLDDGVEGLVHISEASRKKVDNLNEIYKVGDRVNVVVLGVDAEKRRLSLSIKHYEMMAEKEELTRILNTTNPSKVTLGEIMKNKLSGKS
ncbi:MAG: (d)CMP kinase [Spirochaetes bacterium]|nr:(d)CMP kinase [Spirochaetota bacterium]